MSKKEEQPKPEGVAIGVVKLDNGRYQIVKVRSRGRQLLGWEVLTDDLVHLDVKMQLQIAMSRFIREYET